MTFLTTKNIHANLYQQYNSHVAYNAKHVISVDTSKINRNSLVNCAKCQKDKMAQFIADTGPSSTVFIKHDIIVKGKLCTVTSKLQPVYYAPEISY